MTSRMEFRNYRSSAQLVHCNIHRKRYNHFPEACVFVNSTVSYRPFPKSYRQERPPEAVPADCPQSKPMDTFLFHRNCKRRIHQSHSCGMEKNPYWQRTKVKVKPVDVFCLLFDLIYLSFDLFSLSVTLSLRVNRPLISEWRKGL